MRQIAMVVLSIIGILGLFACSTTQCDTMHKALKAAEANYNVAVANKVGGDQLAKYRWTLEAAKANVDIVCAPVAP